MNRPIPQHDLLELCQRGVRAALDAGADQAEVFATSHTESEASLEKNDLNQTRRVEETTFGIRVLKSGSMGFCTSNQASALTEAAREAVLLAGLSPADENNGLPSGEALQDAAPAVDPDLLDLGVPELTSLCMELLESTRSQDARLTIDSGSVSVTHGTQAIASSEGTQASFEGANAGGYLFGMCVDGEAVGSFSYDGDTVRNAADLRPRLESAFSRFVKKCAGAMDAESGESFRGSIILPPDTVQEFLIGNLLAMLGADRVRLGQSPFAQKVGESIASPLFTLVEEGPGLPEFRLAPFDREGTPRQRMPLVVDGVLQGFLSNSYEARAAQSASTGHATGGASSTPHVGPSCLSLAGGTTPLDSLSDIERGVLVTRFSGSTNPITGDFSGVIKGGFLIRDGERTPIEETTMAGNIYDCLKNISAVSNERRLINGSAYLPALRIDDVSISAS